MKDEEIIVVKVKSPKGMTIFEIQPWESKNPEELQIEDEFYIKYSTAHSLPSNLHFEMQILNDLENHPNRKFLHIHKSEKIKQPTNFICWTPQVYSDTEMLVVIEAWCVGTVYSMENAEYFEKILGEIDPTELDAVINFFKKNHGISMLEMKRC